jgi:hypothetical protein
VPVPGAGNSIVAIDPVIGAGRALLFLDASPLHRPEALSASDR